MLVFESQTPQDMLREVAGYLNTLRLTSFYSGAEAELGLIAQELHRAIVLPPEGLPRSITVRLKSN